MKKLLFFIIISGLSITDLNGSQTLGTECSSGVDCISGNCGFSMKYDYSNTCINGQTTLNKMF